MHRNKELYIKIGQCLVEDTGRFRSFRLTQSEEQLLCRVSTSTCGLHHDVYGEISGLPPSASKAFTNIPRQSNSGL